MSIILKGIDIPSKPTQIKIYPNGIIFCANEDGINVPKAQVIQIPKDHGRIGDIDKIIKSLPTEYLGSTVHAIINEAPAILETED